MIVNNRCEILNCFNKFFVKTISKCGSTTLRHHYGRHYSQDPFAHESLMGGVLPSTLYPKNRKEVFDIFDKRLPVFCFLREPHSRFKTAIRTALIRYKTNIEGETTIQELNEEYIQVLKDLDNNGNEKNLLNLLSLIKRDNEKDEQVSIETHIAPMHSFLILFHKDDPIIYKDYKEIDSVVSSFGINPQPKMYTRELSVPPEKIIYCEELDELIDNNSSVINAIKETYKKDFELYSSKVTSLLV